MLRIRAVAGVLAVVGLLLVAHGMVGDDAERSVTRTVDVPPAPIDEPPVYVDESPPIGVTVVPEQFRGRSCQTDPKDPTVQVCAEPAPANPQEEADSVAGHGRPAAQR